MTDTVLLLRTCPPDMRTYGGFIWPDSGRVECPDWDPAPECGGGLHGLLRGCGNGSLLHAPGDDSTRWIVWEANAADVVDLGGKAKAPRGVVVYCGDRDGAIALLQERYPDAPIVYGTATAGDGGTATAGDGGTATAGDGGTATAGDYGTATAGYRGTATAGNHGAATAGVYGTATAGYRGTATAGNHGAATAGVYGTATAGDGGTATAGEGGTATVGYCGTATTGHYGTATAGDHGVAEAGVGGIASTGDYGEIRIRWRHGDRLRTTIGYVGEDGILPGVLYRCDGEGVLVEVDVKVREHDNG